jgi:hypothetical protein
LGVHLDGWEFDWDLEIGNGVVVKKELLIWNERIRDLVLNELKSKKTIILSLGDRWMLV